MRSFFMHFLIFRHLSECWSPPNSLRNPKKTWRQHPAGLQPRENRLLCNVLVSETLRRPCSETHRTRVPQQHKARGVFQGTFQYHRRHECRHSQEWLLVYRQPKGTWSQCSLLLCSQWCTPTPDLLSIKQKLPYQQRWTLPVPSLPVRSFNQHLIS